MKKISLYILVLSLYIFTLTSIAYAGEFSPKNIYRSVSPSVVLIISGDDSDKSSAGTGSIIDSRGFIITNAHVIYNDAEKRPYKKVLVYLKPDRVTGDFQKDLSRRYEAEVSSYERELDLALLRMIDPPTSLTIIKLEDPTNIEIGEPVAAIGHPETGGLWTLTTGTISSKINNFNDTPGKHVFQTEASINRGNSGGPLVDAHGNILGINTLISRMSPDGLAITDINFSLRSDVAKKWLDAQRFAVTYATLPEERPSTAPSSLGQEKPVTGGEKPAASEPVTGGEKISGSESVTRGKKPQGAEPATPSAGEKAAEKVSPKTVVITESNPYNLDDLRKSQMKEMEGLMEEMRDFMEDFKKRR